MGNDMVVRGHEAACARFTKALRGSRGQVGAGSRSSAASASRVATLGGAAASTLLLVGCCDDGRREMERVAKEYGDAAHLCCKEMLAVDPAGAAECFREVQDWRLETGSKIIAWYQACLDGNRSLAGEVLQGLVQDVEARAGQSCGGVVTLANGRVVTVGIPFGPQDRISLDGTLLSPFGVVLPPQYEITGGYGDRSVALRLNGGSFSLQAFDTQVSGALSGTLTIAPGSDAEFLVTDAAWNFTVGSHTVTFDLDDEEGLSRLRIDGQRGTLRMVMATGLPEGVGLLFPPRVVLEVPLRVGGGVIQLDASSLPALDVMPGALGFADWNADGAVTLEDWFAFFASEPIDGVDARDLDLDGDYDSDDERAFVASWRERATLH
jgi:hypothetical protein